MGRTLKIDGVSRKFGCQGPPPIAGDGTHERHDGAYQPHDPVLLYAAWRKAGATAELHVYEHGGHGFDLHPKGTTSDHWFDEFVWWLQTRGLLRAAKDQAR